MGEKKGGRGLGDRGVGRERELSPWEILLLAGGKIDTCFREEYCCSTLGFKRKAHYCCVIKKKKEKSQGPVRYSESDHDTGLSLPFHLRLSV